MAPSRLRGDRSFGVLDGDSDGFGNPDISVQSCEAPDRTTPTAGDCDDSNAEVSPKVPNGGKRAAKEQLCGIRRRVPGPSFLSAGVVRQPLWLGKGRPLFKTF